MRRHHRLIVPLLFVFVVACASDPSTDVDAADATASTSAASTRPVTTEALGGTSTTVTAPADDMSSGDLPIGDGRVSAVAEVGSVFSCQQSFGGGGASATGAWFDEAAGTWDPAAKPTVDGEVSWPDATFVVEVDGDARQLKGNDLPDHATGEFPIDPSDDAYAYDRNPNAIAAQELSIEVPAHPVVADEPSCVGMGPIGVLDSGSYLFHALDAGGRDAAAHEIQDACDGHPEMRGGYHYHTLSACVPDDASPSGHSGRVGYVLDGFGLYGPRGDGGAVLTSADLDECHGHTHEIDWDGEAVEMYHYHATADYPYTVGCFRGTTAG